MKPRNRSDQGMCPHNSTDTGPIELDGHNPRSEHMQDMEPSRGQAGCGLVGLLRRRDNPGAGAIARLFCKRRRCPDCGPRRCARHHARYLELLGGYLQANPDVQLVSFTVASGAWTTLARRLRRHHAPYLRVPTDAGDLVVTIAGVDLDRADLEHVADVGQLLERVFTWDPASGFDTRRTSAAGWEAPVVDHQEKPQVSGAATGDATGAVSGNAEPGGWELVGFVGHPYFAAVAIAERLDCQPQAVPERELGDDWAEAHSIRLPAEDTPAWRSLLFRLQIRPPTTRAQDREVREHRQRLRARGRSVQDRLPGVAA
jgi:hypothetical protein